MCMLRVWMLWVMAVWDLGGELLGAVVHVAIGERIRARGQTVAELVLLRLLVVMVCLHLVLWQDWIVLMDCQSDGYLQLLVLTLMWMHVVGCVVVVKVQLFVMVGMVMICLLRLVISSPFILFGLLQFVVVQVLPLLVRHQVMVVVWML